MFAYHAKKRKINKEHTQRPDGATLTQEDLTETKELSSLYVHCYPLPSRASLRSRIAGKVSDSWSMMILNSMIRGAPGQNTIAIRPSRTHPSARGSAYVVGIG